MKKFFQNALLLCVALLTGAMLIEFFLRIAGIGYPLFTQADPVTGFSLRPGASGWQTDEGRAWVEIIPEGRRDYRRDPAKAEGKIRIAVLGDSFAEGRQVGLGATFPNLMNDELRHCTESKARSVEVMNFGTSGFGTVQEILQLQTNVWKYSPDIVVLAFTTGNDIKNNSFALEGSRDKPYFRMEDGQLALDTSFRESPGFKRQTEGLSSVVQSLINRSRLLQLLNRVRSVLGKSSPAVKESPSGAKTGKEVGLDDAVYSPPTSPQWSEAWTITESLLKMMSDDVKNHHAKFLVVTLSNGIQVHPDKDIREEYRREIGSQNLFYPDRRIATAGNRDGYPVLTLAESMLETAERDRTFFHGFQNTVLGEGHWNEKGHAEAGKLISAFLCKEGFLR